MHLATRFGASFLFVTALIGGGCARPIEKVAKMPAPVKPAPVKAEKGDDHEHGEGPHGGAVADWGGGKYHIEFTVDHDKQEATVYLLGGDALKPAPLKMDKLLLSIKEPMFQTELKAMPQEGDPKGTSSRFVGKHEKLGAVREFAGTVSGELDGTPYAGDFKEEPANKK